MDSGLVFTGTWCLIAFVEGVLRGKGSRWKGEFTDVDCDVVIDCLADVEAV